jgi:hypothetical protein
MPCHAMLTHTRHLLKVPRMLPLRQLIQRGPRNSITRELGEQVEQDTRIRRLIKAGRGHTAAQLRGPTPRDLDIDALRVRLGAVSLARGVQRNDLVAQDVVAGCEVGNRQVPGEVVLDEVVGDPGAGVVAGFPGAALDLGPAEGGGVADAAEVPGDGRDVFLHGAGVGDGPGVLREC